MQTLEEVKAVVDSIDDWDEDTSGYNAAVVLLSGAVVGADEEAVTEFTGLPRDLVDAYGANLRNNGIWKDGITYCDWDNEETGGMSFLLDVNVALGLIAKVPEEV